MSEAFDERQYWPSKWSKRLSEDVICSVHYELAVNETNKNKEQILSEGNLQYSDSATEVMDVYGRDLPPSSPLFVYIHGGYWIEYTKDSSGYCARPLWQAGIRVCVPDYDLAPKKSLTGIVSQMQKMAEFTLKKAEAEGSSGVWICGHSAGAHLAARLLDEVWLNTLNEKRRKLFKGVFLIGGVYDLEPILKLNEVNDVLKMTKEEATEQSPINLVTNFKQKQLVDLNFKTIVVVAENESNAFKNQSHNYYKLLNQAGMNAEYLLLPELDHFDVVENLRESDYVLTKKILKEILGKE